MTDSANESDVPEEVTMQLYQTLCEESRAYTYMKSRMQGASIIPLLKLHCCNDKCPLLKEQKTPDPEAGTEPTIRLTATVISPSEPTTPAPPISTSAPLLQKCKLDRKIIQTKIPLSAEYTANDWFAFRI